MKQARCFLLTGRRHAAASHRWAILTGERCEKLKHPFQSMSVAGWKRHAAGRAESQNRKTPRQPGADFIPVGFNKNHDRKTKRFFPLNLIPAYLSRV
ncbi:hypothetical protein [Burkholderia ambifaria]|uniref:hypothetical protein n=1 Tax=Burkholderia ambifaria TaxID=152480 RepID=UPI001588A17C|nr:hypothetical protein [Burkholderia ambifaria]MBR8346159.1 hypothetical protein [Burkholderia ambifaria]